MHSTSVVVNESETWMLKTKMIQKISQKETEKQLVRGQCVNTITNYLCHNKNKTRSKHIDNLENQTKLIKL